MMDQKLDAQVTTSNMTLSTMKSGVNYTQALNNPVLLQISELIHLSRTVHSVTINMRSVQALLHKNILSLQAAPRGLGMQ
ncbi:hypothetical protein V8E51_009141 [Hyaloscypha variabilis]